MTTAKGMLAVWMDVPADKEEEFNDWYNTEHIPTLMRVPGFRAVQRLVATRTPMSAKAGRPPSGPRYLALYDIESEKALQSQDFDKARESPWGNRIRKFRVRRFHMVYRLIFQQGTAPGK